MTHHEPVPPDDRSLGPRAEAPADAVAAAEPLSSPHTGADEATRAEVTAAVERSSPDLVALSQDLHAHPEEGFAEHRSVRALAGLLERHGHEATVGVGGLDTALRVSTPEPAGPPLPPPPHDA